eukprot:s1073_g1.t1
MGARDFWGLYLKRSSSALSYLWVHGRVRAWSTSIVKMSKDELLSGVRLTFLCASCGLPGFAQAIRKESELYRNTFSKTVSVVISSNRLTALAEDLPCPLRPAASLQGRRLKCEAPSLPPELLHYTRTAQEGGLDEAARLLGRVIVRLNGIESSCLPMDISDELSCTYGFARASTPSVVEVTPLEGATLEHEAPLVRIVVAGWDGAHGSDLAQVFFGSQECEVNFTKRLVQPCAGLKSSSDGGPDCGSGHCADTPDAAEFKGAQNAEFAPLPASVILVGTARSVEIRARACILAQCPATMVQTEMANAPAFQGNCVSRSFLTWVFPICRRSADVEQLQVSDLFEVEADARPEVQVKSFLDQWRAKVGSLPPGRQRRRSGWLLLQVLAKLHVPRLSWWWMLRFLQAFLQFSFPLFLNLIIKFVEQDDAPVWQGLVLCLAMFSTEGLAGLVDAAASVGLQTAGLRIRASLVSAIFRKVVLLRQDSMLSFSTGKLNNMITTDVDKAKRALRYLHVLLLTAPMKIFIALWSLHSLVGPSVFIGLSWMGVVILLNPAMMYIMNRLEDAQQATTDERVRKVTEVISSINVIKCYGWEEPATAKVEVARRAELSALWRLYCLYTVFEGMWSSVVPCCTALMFASYSWLNPDKPLTPSQAFTAISLLGMVQDPLFTIPWVLNLLIEAFVAAKRIEGLFWLSESSLPAISALGSFLPVQEERRQPSMASMVPPLKLDTGSAIRLDHASFVWKEPREGQATSLEEGEQRGDFQLHDLTLHVQKGSLVAVVGPTGSGKSSFLQALLGEMLKKDGSGKVEVSRAKPIAFVPQQPWVFNATIRQNILFGEPYAENLYRECLRSSDLEEDLRNLQAGDQTRVGEKGIALSGGQKARICLARAAYRVPSRLVLRCSPPFQDN